MCVSIRLAYRCKSSTEADISWLEQGEGEKMLSGRTINYRSVGLFKLQIMRPTEPHLWTNRAHLIRSADSLMWNTIAGKPYKLQGNEKANNGEGVGGGGVRRNAIDRQRESNISLLLVVLLFFFLFANLLPFLRHVRFFSSFFSFSRGNDGSYLEGMRQAGSRPGFLEIGIISSTTWKLCQ